MGVEYGAPGLNGMTEENGEYGRASSTVKGRHDAAFEVAIAWKPLASCDGPISYPFEAMTARFAAWDRSL